MEISVIIPVYNGEKTIPELYKRLKSVLEKKYSFELLFIHDSGKDNSWSIINRIRDKDRENVKGFQLLHNYGQHNAILFGLKEAKGDLIITLDEDLQHNPSLISKLIEKQKESDYDVVYAKFIRLKHPGLRIWTSELLRGILKRIVPGLFPAYSPYRLIKRDVAKQITNLKNSYTFIDGYLGMVTNKFGYINAEHFKRADGVSSYSYYKLFKHALMIGIAYSPLKKWILTAALIFNSLSIVLLFTSGLITNTVQIKFLCALTGGLGILLLLCGLIAEIIHYRRIKTNLMPVEINEK